MTELTVKQKSKLLREVSDRTLEATLDKLKQTGKVMIVRPTGFGKSYMLARISAKYESSLYIYPLSIIKDTVQEDYKPGNKTGAELHNVTFISYSALNNHYKNGTLMDFLSKFDIVMIDECHMAGAAGFTAIYSEASELFGKNKKHLVGVTATPNRQSKTKMSDGTEISVDVLHDIFDGNQIFRYTMRECIRSGLMMRPIYAQIIYDTASLKGSIRRRIEIAQKKYGNNDLVKDEMFAIIKQLFSAMNDIENAPTQIKKVITEARGSRPSYLKFFVFCRNKKDIEERRRAVTKWFEEAFTSMYVRENIVVSRSNTTGLDYEDEIKRIEEIGSISVESNTIDLIYCIDMLNMGYHVSDVDGIVMLRGTESEIVYLQQIGRCMSVKSTKPPIILDFVRNADVHPLFKDGMEKDLKQGDLQADDEQSEQDIDDILTKQDVYIQDIEDGRGNFLKKLDAAMEAIEHPEDREINLLCWWYVERSAPVHTLLQLINKPITEKNIADVVKKLKSRGVKIENEKESIRNMGMKQKAALPKIYVEKFGA